MIKKTTKILVICTSALIASAVMSPASAQDTAKRLERVEKQLKAVQRKVFGEGGIPAGTMTQQAVVTGTPERKLMADMSVKISSIEKQMRDITGRLESIEYRQEQLTKKLEMFTKDTSIRFDEMRENAASTTSSGGTASSQTTLAAPANAPEMALPDGDVNSQYDWAFAYIRKNDLKNGQKAMELFIAKHPKDEVSANAYFWLGRVHLQSGKYGKAAEQFLNVFEGFPTHQKAPEALTNLGEAMIKLGENGSACEAFLEFRRAYPDANDRLKRRVNGDEKKAGC